MLYIVGEEFKINARELWQFYGAPGEFRTWFSQIVSAQGLKEGKDFLLKIIESKNGRPRKDAFLTEEIVRKIQLGYGKSKHDVQAAVAKKTVEIDELLKNPRMLAKLFLDYADTKDKLELLHHSDCLLTMQEIAKDLGYESAFAVNEILVQKGYMYRDKRGRALPRAGKIPAECYAIKAQEASDGKVFNYLKWTMRGKEWIAAFLAQCQ